jgi:putative homogalacturonan methyltransferase
MDRILRPEGTAIIRDRPDAIKRLTIIAHAIRWTTEVYESEPESNRGEKILVAKKT